MIDEARGLVSREIFVSEGIYQRELEAIFNRLWIFVAHESELPNGGDFVTRTLGTEPVIAIRGDDGGVAVLLNSCRHRGAKLCRTAAGSTKAFVCPYHGWTYDRGGALLSTRFEKLFPPDADLTTWGLVAAPRVASYAGLIFASWAPQGPSLADALGDFRWYLDLFLARTPGGMEVLGPPQRSRVKANWKIAAANFGTDNQHVYTTHVGPFTLDEPVISRRERMTTAMSNGVQVSTAGGHSCTLLVSRSDEPYRLFPSGLRALYDRTLAPDQQRLLRDVVIGVGTVFPNLSFNERTTFGPDGGWVKTLVLRLWHPLGPNEIELWSWSLAEREADEGYKQVSRANGQRAFGIAGLFEQEDVELWTSIGAASSGPIARAYPFNFQTALPTLHAPLADFAGPGDAYQPFEAEITQFRFFMHWNEVVAGGA
jgi:nitrite reductase/ring-hydroxylating ferredoxin subunit